MIDLPLSRSDDDDIVLADTSIRGILIVDDDPASLDAMERILSCQGFLVTTFSTANAAIAALEDPAAQKPDLVITDLYLGGALGYDVAVAAGRCHPTIPVLLVTGKPSFDGAQRALSSNVAEILPKPIEADALVAAARRVVWSAKIQRRANMLEATNKVLESVMPRVIEAKDPTTSGHSQRVVHYVEVLAGLCKVDPRDHEQLRLAALLHDVGKIGVPEGILTKEGPLDADERKKVEAHPEIGFDIVRKLDDMENVGIWVYQHHERWDGSGYPNGLKGDEVALPGRILVLAEVYDALAEPRSYKPAWPTERIVGFFRAQAGKHFDPDLAHLVADGLEEQGRRFFASSSDSLF